MGRDWKFRFFVPELEFGEDIARRLLDVAAGAGFSPMAGGGDVHTSSREGDQATTPVEELVEWWVSEEGGFSLVHRSNGMEFFISVASPDKTDAVPLTWLSMTMVRWLFREDRTARWASIHELVDGILRAFPVALAFGTENWMLDELTYPADVDEVFIQGRLPFIGWMTAAPADSALGQQVLEAADLLGLDPILRNGYVELFLTSEPSEETFEKFVSANRQWGTPLGAP